MKDSDLVALLNYYELIGTAFDKNTLDQDLILHVRRGPISLAYDVCKEYIQKRRESLNAPRLYENMIKVKDAFREEVGPTT